MALDFRQKSAKPFEMFTLRSDPDGLAYAPPPCPGATNEKGHADMCMPSGPKHNNERFLQRVKRELHLMYGPTFAGDQASAPLLEAL